MTSDSDSRSLPPACRETVDRLQRVLDAELPGAALEADIHVAECRACRQRIAAAQLLIATFSAPDKVSTPAGIASTIVSAVLDDRARSRRLRRRAYSLGGGLVAVAALLLALGTSGYWKSPETPHPQVDNIAAVPTPGPKPAPVDPKPVRLGEEFAKAEQAIIDSSRPITDPAVTAPQVLLKLTDALTRPAEPTSSFEPARKSLLELPEAARTGLEPVTATTQKAFARLLQDVSMK